MEWILENWGELLLACLAVAKIVANLTPGTKDDQIVFGWLDVAINAVVKNVKKDEAPDEIERRG